MYTIIPARYSIVSHDWQDETWNTQETCTHALKRATKQRNVHWWLILPRPSLSHMKPCELSPCSRPFHCNNDSDSCHCQEEEKLKLGCESAFSRKPNKKEEQREDSELWVTLKMDNVKNKREKKQTLGIHRASGRCFLSSLGRMFSIVGFCSTMLSPSSHYSKTLWLFVKVFTGSYEADFIRKVTYHFHICCNMSNVQPHHRY